MKKLLFVFALLSMSLFVAANRDLDKIERLVEPYEKAIDFVVGLNQTHDVNDNDIFVFFSQNDLYKRKDIARFDRIVRLVKRLTYCKKSLHAHREQLELLIDRLQNVQNFIIEYAAIQYALTTYYEIAARYYYIDEHHADIVHLIMQQSDKLGLPSMQGRGLYKFVQKIDLDLRRLIALFAQYPLSNNLTLKLNALKIKLASLKGQIVAHSLYKTQLMKNRWLKACLYLSPAIIFIGICFSCLLFVGISPETSLVIPLCAFIVTISVYVGITVINKLHTFKENHVYNLCKPYTSH